MTKDITPPRNAPQALGSIYEAIYTERLEKRNGHIRVPTSLFIEQVDVKMSQPPPLSFYAFENDGFRLLKPANQPYSPLVLSLHEFVWVPETEFAQLRRFAEQQILNTGSPLPKEQRMELLRKSAMAVVEDLFGNPTPENITRSTKVVSSFVYVLMKEPSAYQLLSRLSSHDPYTLQHSVGTAVNCIILGRKLGISDEVELNELGIAGLLHDIGKVKVKKEIINKEGPLDDLEWEEMRQHASAGYEIIKDHPELSEHTKRAILEHHEDKNGTGYPQGLQLAQLGLFSKIVCICDVYNALTTNRSYSKARTPFEAFQFMREKLGHKLDDRIFKELILIYGGNFDSTPN